MQTIKQNFNKSVKELSRSAKHVGFSCLIHLGLLLISMMLTLGSFVGRTSPLGIAVVAAVPYTHLSTPVLGVLISAIFLPSLEAIRYIASTLVLAGVRLLIRNAASTAGIFGFDAILSAAVVFSTGLAMYISEDIGWVFVSQAALTFIATVIFKGGAVAVSRLYRGRTLTLYIRNSLLLSLLLIVVYAKDFSLYSISPTTILYFAVCLAIVNRSEGTVASSIGLQGALAMTLAGDSVLGVACGCAILGASFFSNTMNPKEKLAEVGDFDAIYSIGFFIIAQTILVLSGGDMYSSMVEITITTLLFIAMPPSLKKRIANMFKVKKPKQGLTRSSQKLTQVAQAMEDIANNIGADEKHLPPELLSSTVDSCCKHCLRSSVCWGAQYSASMDMLNAISNTLRKDGFLNEVNLPKHFLDICVNPQEFATHAQREFAQFQSDMKPEKIHENDVIKGHYKNFSLILSDIGETIDDNDERDISLEERVKSLFHDKGAQISSIEASYNRHDKLRICGNSNEPLPNLDFAQPAIGTLTRRKIAVPEVWKSENSWHFVINEEQNFSISSAKFVSPAANESIAGDTVREFRTQDMHYVAVISDGMGAGKKAANKSSTAVDYLEKLMQAGLRRDTAVKILNGAMISSEASEVFTTLDCMILDMYSGEIEFVKAGAAPCFVLRGKELAKVECKSLPIGILDEVEAEIYHMRAYDGDIIIMMSDGVLSHGDDGKALMEFCRNFDPNSGNFAKAIVSFAAEHMTAKERDDMSALVLKINTIKQR